MLLNTNNATTQPNRATGRQIEYLIIFALIGITAMLLFAMGVFSHAAAETRSDRKITSGTWEENVVGTITSPAISSSTQNPRTVQIANLMARTNLATAKGRPASLTAQLADRHIMIGSTLLAIALMAATTFGLWRWQLRGLILEAQGRV